MKDNPIVRRDNVILHPRAPGLYISYEEDFMGIFVAIVVLVIIVAVVIAAVTSTISGILDEEAGTDDE